MKHKLALFSGILALLAVIAALWFGLSQSNVAVLQPQGTIADSQRSLLVTATVLMLFIVVPVFVMTFFIAWKYREGNTKATYSPKWGNSKLAETIWWGIPLILIAILSVMIWSSSHSLDPTKPITSDKPAVNVQVVALQWKWLFIYPDEQLATVNELYIPSGRPVNFTITSDAPMNSFWIPQLGGQIYAMAGMSTQLHLEASKPGEYRGVSANISGEGFAGMNFAVKALNDSDYQTWVATSKQSNLMLDQAAYTILSKPTTNNPPQTFSAVDANLYDTIVEKYMAHVDNGMAPVTNGDHHQ